MDEAQIHRLEKESERFGNEIRKRESENKQLRENISSIKSQIEESKKTYDEIAKVS